MKIHYLEDNLVEIAGPTDVALDSAVEAATVTATLYDENAETTVATGITRLREDAAASATTLTVPMFTPVWIKGHATDGDGIEIDLDDGSVHTTSVAAYAAGSEGTEFDTITLTTGIPTAAEQGRQIRIFQKNNGVDDFLVESAKGLEASDTVEITAQDLTLNAATITQIIEIQSQEQDPDNVENVLVPAPNQRPQTLVQLISTIAAVDLRQRARVRRRLGSDVTMTIYGTPRNPGDFSYTWGYRGVIPSDQNFLRAGQTVRVSVAFQETGGSTLTGVRDVMAQVVEAETAS